MLVRCHLSGKARIRAEQQVALELEEGYLSFALPS